MHDGPTEKPGAEWAKINSSNRFYCEEDEKATKSFKSVMTVGECKYEDPAPMIMGAGSSSMNDDRL